MGEYAVALEGLKKLPGIKAALVLNEEGEILEKFGDLPKSKEDVTHLVVESLKTAEKLADLLRTVELEQNYLEYKDLNITFDRLSKTTVMVVLALSGTNLGRIRYELKKNKKLFENEGKNAR